MDNLLQIHGSSPSDTAKKLTTALGNALSLDITNGAYAPPREAVLPTTLAGFKFITDYIADEHTPLIVGINSDKSPSPTELEGQEERAAKFMTELAAQNPNRHVIALFYDEETPKKLFEALLDEGFEINSLHKWGYGGGDAPAIIGEEYAQRVFSFPLPFQDIVPTYWNQTPAQSPDTKVEIVDLREVNGLHGAPYMTREGGKLLFPVTPSAQEFAAPKLQ